MKRALLDDKWLDRTRLRSPRQVTDIYLLGVLTWEMLFGTPPPVPAPGQLDPPEVPVLPERPLPEVLRRVLSDNG